MSTWRAIRYSMFEATKEVSSFLFVAVAHVRGQGSWPNLKSFVDTFRFSTACICVCQLFVSIVKFFTYLRHVLMTEIFLKLVKYLILSLFQISCKFHSFQLHRRLVSNCKRVKFLSRIFSFTPINVSISGRERLKF